MTLAQYQDLDWQMRDEAFFQWCEANDRDHTDPDSREEFLEELS